MSRYRHDFALLHPSRPELLVLSSGDALTLPSMTSQTWLHAKELLKGLRARVFLDAVMLRPALYRDAEADTRAILYVLAARADRLPIGARWLSLEALRAGALSYPYLKALEEILEEDADPSLLPTLRPDWTRRGWLSEVESWFERELARLGQVPVGEPEQIRHWGISAVLKQKTDGGEVYVKAVIEHFIAEPRVTAAVAELFPDLTPKVLATEPTRGWMVLEPFRGVELTKSPVEVQWRAFRRFSALQLESLAHKETLLKAGCTDRSLDTLKKAVPWLFRESLELDKLTPDEHKRLLGLEPTILEQIDMLAACGVPETLVHGDIHFNNVVAEGDDVTIFDWTNACWSHPFFDIALQYSHDRSSADRIPLIEAYLGPWLERHDEEAVRKAFTLADALSPLFYAWSYEGILRAQEPGARGELSGVVATYLKERLLKLG